MSFKNLFHSINSNVVYSVNKNQYQKAFWRSKSYERFTASKKYSPPAEPMTKVIRPFPSHLNVCFPVSAKWSCSQCCNACVLEIQSASMDTLTSSSSLEWQETQIFLFLPLFFGSSVAIRFKTLASLRLFFPSDAAYHVLGNKKWSRIT